MLVPKLEGRSAVDRPGSVVVGDLDEVPWNIGGRSVPVELCVVRAGDAARRGRQHRREVPVHPAEVRAVDVGAVMSVIGFLTAAVVPKPWSPVVVHMVPDHPVGPSLTPDRPLELRRDGRRGRGRRWRGRRASVPAGPHQEAADQETTARKPAAASGGRKPAGRQDDPTRIGIPISRVLLAKGIPRPPPRAAPVRPSETLTSRRRSGTFRAPFILVLQECSVSRFELPALAHPGNSRVGCSN